MLAEVDNPRLLLLPMRLPALQHQHQMAVVNPAYGAMPPPPLVLGYALVRIKSP